MTGHQLQMLLLNKTSDSSNPNGFRLTQFGTTKINREEGTIKNRTSN